MGIHQFCPPTYCGNPPILSSELLWESTRVYKWIPTVARRTELMDSHSRSEDRINSRVLILWILDPLAWFFTNFEQIKKNCLTSPLKLPLASCAALSRTSQDYLSFMFLESLNGIPTNQTWDEDVLFSSPLSPSPNHWNVIISSWAAHWSGN